LQQSSAGMLPYGVSFPFNMHYTAVLMLLLK
jgi:hypothetical protein